MSTIKLALKGIAVTGLATVVSLGIILAVAAMSGCTHIEPGHVGVKIDSCSGGGVEQEVAGVGYHAVGPCTSIVEYPTYVQTAIWSHNPNEGHPANEEITFTNADQMQVAVDISLAYQLDATKVPAFYAKFRADNLDEFTHGFLRNLAREKFDAAAGKYKIEQIMGDNAVFIAEVRSALQADLNAYGVQITQFGFSSAPRPPGTITDAINAKLAAVQKSVQIENELRQAEAEARKSVAKADGEAKVQHLKADAEAYANERIGRSISPTLVEYERVKRWDGKMPQVSGGASPFITLGK